MAKQGDRGVPLRGGRQQKKRTLAEVEKELVQTKLQLQELAQNAQADIADMTFEIGELTMKNKRQQRMIVNLVERLSKYEDVESIPAPESESEEGDTSA